MSDFDINKTGRTVPEDDADEHFVDPSSDGRKGCQCGHDSDCSVHNEPAYPAGGCDCSLSKHPTTSSEPVAWMTMDRSARGWHLTFENPEPVKQHLLAIKELYTHPTPTLSAAELERICQLLTYLKNIHPIVVGQGAFYEIRAAIALLEKGKT